MENGNTSYRFSPRGHDSIVTSVGSDAPPPPPHQLMPFSHNSLLWCYSSRTGDSTFHCPGSQYHFRTRGLPVHLISHRSKSGVTPLEYIHCECRHGQCPWLMMTHQFYTHVKSVGSFLMYPIVSEIRVKPIICQVRKPLLMRHGIWEMRERSCFLSCSMLV